MYIHEYISMYIYIQVEMCKSASWVTANRDDLEALSRPSRHTLARPNKPFTRPLRGV